MMDRNLHISVSVVFMQFNPFPIPDVSEINC